MLHEVQREFFRTWRRLVLVPVAFAMVAVASWLFLPSYVARSSVAPESGAGASQLAGLAQQFGIGSAALMDGQSIDYYVEVMLSREVMTATAEHRYRFRTSRDADAETRSGTIAELFDIAEDTPVETQLEAVEELRKRVGIERLADAGIIGISVRTPWPELSEQINRRILALTDEFNTQRRQSSARLERAFVEQRLAESRRELAAAEESLRRFLETNRAGGTSPRLLQEQTRLQRQIELAQAVYRTLVQSYEQARIDEVRDTPVLTIIDRPDNSAKRAGNIIVALILSLIAGTAVAAMILAAKVAWPHVLRGARG